MREKKNHTISATEKMVLYRGFLCKLGEIIWLISGLKYSRRNQESCLHQRDTSPLIIDNYITGIKILVFSLLQDYFFNILPQGVLIAYQALPGIH